MLVPHERYGEEEPPAVLQNPRDILHERVRLENVLEHLIADHGVERAVFERQTTPIVEDIGLLGAAILRRVELEADVLLGGHKAFVRASATADVEHAAANLRGELLYGGKQLLACEVERVDEQPPDTRPHHLVGVIGFKACQHG